MITILSLMACAQSAELPSRVESLPFYDSAEFTPRWEDPQALPADFHQIPDFALLNQHGETITQADMDGQITVVNFFFASCTGICPQLSQAMKRVDESLPEEGVVLLSHSVTPQTDTPEVLAQFAKDKGLESDRWHLLTGDQALIYSLGRSAYFVEEDLGEEKDLTEFLHTENLVLLDEDRHIRGIYNGLNATSVGQLITDANTLIVASGGGEL